MTIEKEIRAVALHMFEPDGKKLEAMLMLMERTHPQVQIRYNRGNPYDASCMEIMLGLKVIGYVNADDKRYVEPLLRDSNSCTADFLEVYSEEGHRPVIRFLVTVDLDNVEPLRPGDEWANWNYTGPVIPILDSLSTVTYAGEMLKDLLTRKTSEDYATTEELIEAFVEASMFDMSVETSMMYDDLLFYLEMSRRRNRRYINLLQHGSTVRRTDRKRAEFLKEWWPRFICSEVSKRLCRTFAMEVEKRHGDSSPEVWHAEYKHLQAEMILLPYSIYERLDDVEAVWATMYYSKISREKFLQVLSTMIIYTKLTNTIKNNQPFVIEESKTVFIQTFESGSNAQVFNG